MHLGGDEEAMTSAMQSEECKQLIAKLSNIVNKHTDKAILALYPKLDRKIALTAWRRIDKFDRFSEGRIEQFMSKYKGVDHH